MKIIPKYNIGDLVMCKKYCEDAPNNTINIIGWITEIKCYLENNLVAYTVQWSDENDELLISESQLSVHREYFEKIRNSGYVA